MNLIVDMNLAPAWCGVLNASGFTAAHWSAIGDPRAPDSQIMAEARRRRAVVLTSDLDFPAILASAAADGPSVVLLRARDVSPEALGALVVTQLSAHRTALSEGAVLSIDDLEGRLRWLPLPPPGRSSSNR